MTEHATGAQNLSLPVNKSRLALLVDGYVKDLFATGMLLQRFNYDVYIVNTAEDAQRIMESVVPALVITELALPQTSGLELLINIRQDPRTKAVPVIIYTAANDPQKERHCRASGCSSFLKKPAEPDELYRTIQKVTEVTPRHHIRVKTLLPVMVGGLTMTGGVVSTECVSELSEDGIFVRTLNPRSLNVVLPVTIMIHSIPVKLRAAVLRTCTIGAGSFKEPGMALKFVDISDTDRELIRNFIMGMLTQDIPRQ